ncbi:hypothetical protein I3760_16G112900 [Carya illinoinensis]|nr:hypothetical protein I3760_16G112900 [Carya illinoinensis]
MVVLILFKTAMRFRNQSCILPSTSIFKNSRRLICIRIAYTSSMAFSLPFSSSSSSSTSIWSPDVFLSFRRIDIAILLLPSILCSISLLFTKSHHISLSKHPLKLN